LVISTRLVRLMGGELELQSQAGKGSTFSFVVNLPVGADEPAAPLLPDAPVSHSGAVVLLVDDNPVALETSASQMQALGWEVVQAVSGADAIGVVSQRLQRGLPDFEALFVDWQMPDMDGWDTLRNVRRLYGDRPVPALVLMSGQSQSALAGRTDREQELLDGFLVKPLTSNMFREALEQTRRRVYASDGVLVPKQVLPKELAVQSLNGMRLLVVEDNVINQQVAQELLTAQGALVTLASDGRMGVDAILGANKPFDVVLMDLQMPVMDGLTATRMIRSHRQFAQLPIIAMTANAMSSDKEACLAAGMTDHIGKPFDLQDLVKTLVRHTGWQGALVEEAATLSLPPQVWPAEIAVEVSLKRMGGNVGLLHRSMQAFMQDAKVLHQRMTTLVNDDMGTALREMHAFKGLAGTLGIESLARLAHSAEKEMKQSDGAATQTALDTLHIQIQRVLPLLHDVADRLLPSNPSETVQAAPQSMPVPDGWMTQFRALHAALKASDMGAMELHAQLRCVPVGGLESALIPLDAAMAELDFEQAAVECEKIILQWAP
jgi:CheY-like chemotaxis protein